MRHTVRSKQGRRAQREEGAAMLAVMMVLMVATTVAAMTVHAISLEVRSAGYYRQQAQTHYVAESAIQGVLSLRPTFVDAEIKRKDLQAIAAELPDITNQNLVTNYGEPDPAYVGPTGKRVVELQRDRMDSTRAPEGGSAAVSDTASLGFQAFLPWYVVHLIDYQRVTQPVAGQNASGNATEQYITATVAVRARTMLGIGGVIAPDTSRGDATTVAGDMTQKFTDAAYDMRVVTRFGPI